MTRIEQIIEALDGECTGDSWIAHCPAHDDKQSSLSVAQKDGKILVHCHAGCSQDAVISALRDRGLWPGGNGQQPTQKQSKSRKPAAVFPIPDVAKTSLNKKLKTGKIYDEETETWMLICKKYGRAALYWKYHNAEGGWVFSVVRHEKSNGKVVLPYYYGKDKKWHQGQAYKTGRPLYRLHKLIASSDPILIVEGEKCANIQVSGYILTTWAGGSSAVSKTNWSWLAEREVLIWPDADDAGIKAAVAIRNCLPNAKILQIEDKPSGWDIADAVAEGIDPAKFIAECPIAELHEEPQGQKDDNDFFWAPTHGLAADILLAAFGNTWIFERHDSSGHGEFFCRVNCYYIIFGYVKSGCI